MWKVAGSRSNRIATLIGSFSLGIANLAIGLSPSPRAWQLSGKDIETNCVHLFARPGRSSPETGTIGPMLRDIGHMVAVQYAIP